MSSSCHYCTVVGGPVNVIILSLLFRGRWASGCHQLGTVAQTFVVYFFASLVLNSSTVVKNLVGNCLNSFCSI